MEAGNVFLIFGIRSAIQGDVYGRMILKPSPVSLPSLDWLHQTIFWKLCDDGRVVPSGKQPSGNFETCTPYDHFKKLLLKRMGQNQCLNLIVTSTSLYQDSWAVEHGILLAILPAIMSELQRQCHVTVHRVVESSPALLAFLASDGCHHLTLQDNTCLEVAYAARAWHAANPSQRELVSASGGAGVYTGFDPTSLHLTVVQPTVVKVNQAGNRINQVVEELAKVPGQRKLELRFDDPESDEYDNDDNMGNNDNDETEDNSDNYASSYFPLRDATAGIAARVDLTPIVDQLTEVLTDGPTIISRGHLNRLELSLDTFSDGASQFGVSCDEMHGTFVPIDCLQQLLPKAVVATTGLSAFALSPGLRSTSLKALCIRNKWITYKDSDLEQYINAARAACPNLCLLGYCHLYTKGGDVEIGYASSIALRKPNLSDNRYLFRFEAKAMSGLVLLAYTLTAQGVELPNMVWRSLMQAVVLFNCQAGRIMHIQDFLKAYPESI